MRSEYEPVRCVFLLPGLYSATLLPARLRHLAALASFDSTSLRRARDVSRDERVSVLPYFVLREYQGTARRSNGGESRAAEQLATPVTISPSLADSDSPSPVYFAPEETGRSPARCGGG